MNFKQEAALLRTKGAMVDAGWTAGTSTRGRQRVGADKLIGEGIAVEHAIDEPRATVPKVRKLWPLVTKEAPA
jgi:hypothetical protein